MASMRVAAVLRRCTVRRGGVVALLLATLLASGGCAVGEAHRSAPEVAASIQDAGGQARSAVATVRWAVDLLSHDRLTAPAAETTWADSLRVLAEAERTLTTLTARGAEVGTARDRVLAAVRDATTAVVAAGAWVTASGTSTGADRARSPDQLLVDLDAACDALDVAVAGAGRAPGRQSAGDVTAEPLGAAS